MTPNFDNPSYRYSDFRQACRAYRPSELLPALARLSAAQNGLPTTNAIQHRLPPWGLSAAARESLLHGNEFRSKPVDGRAIEKLMAIFQEATDIPSSDEHRDDFVLSIVTRHAYEQFPWQDSIFEEVSRSHAWMVAGLEEVTTSVVTEASIADMLGGMSLRDAIGATFMLQVGADPGLRQSRA